MKNIHLYASILFGSISMACAGQVTGADENYDEAEAEFEGDPASIRYAGDEAEDNGQAALAFSAMGTAISRGASFTGELTVGNKVLSIRGRGDAISTNKTLFSGIADGSLNISLRELPNASAAGRTTVLINEENSLSLRDEGGVIRADFAGGSIAITGNVARVEFKDTAIEEPVRIAARSIPVVLTRTGLRVEQGGLGRLWDALAQKPVQGASSIQVNGESLSRRYSKEITFADGAALRCDAKLALFSQSNFKKKDCVFEVLGGSITQIQGSDALVQSSISGDQARRVFLALPGEGNVHGFTSDYASWICRTQAGAYECVASAWKNID